jgi:hypothetical protein
MTATRRTDNDFGSSRPILSAEAKGGGLLSGLLQAILPAKGKAQRAEPTLTARATEERREPYFGQRATPGTAD